MADNSEDLVSQIKVTGGNEAAAEIENFADKGAAAFNKLDTAANKSSSGAADATKKVGDAAKSSAANVQELGTAATAANAGLKQHAVHLRDVESASRSFFGSLRQGAQAIGRFSQRIALVGAATQAAAIGFVEAARRVAKSVDTQSTALEQQTQAQINANNTALSGEQAQIQLASSQRQLFTQLQTGKITYTQYNEAIKASNISFREQQRVSAQVENAQERVRLENERLQKQLKDRTAFNQLIDTFGGPLTSSLVQFGRTVEQVRQSIVQSFGPGLAAFVDVIGTAFTKNSDVISTFFTKMSQQFTQFISQNGPAIQLALENLGAAAGAVFEGLIKAGPPLLDFFNNQLVPAFRAIGSFLTSIADTINAVFGTRLTGGFIALIVVLAQLTGSLRLFFSLFRSGILLLQLAVTVLGGPLTIAIIAISAALLLVDWTAFGQSASAAATSVVTAWQAVLNFFTSFPANLNIVFSALWTGVQAGVTSVVQFVISTWNTVLDFFNSLPSTVGAIFVAIGTAIVAAFTNAVETAKGLFNQLLAAARALLQPIIDMLKFISAASDSAGASTPPGFAGGGPVRGPGTTTSDSILARLSNREFVMNARAVAKYGLGLMQSINAGQFKLPEFSGGGFNLITPTPGRTSFADGGAVKTGGSLQPLNLTIDGNVFEGLLMPEDVGRKITKFAIARSTRRAGRKPSWVGGGN